MANKSCSVRTLSGWGTAWVESRADDLDPDHKDEPRAATMWAVGLHMPILPLAKVVLAWTGTESCDFYGTGETTTRPYVVLQKLRLNLLECSFTWLWRWLVVLPTVLAVLLWLPCLVMLLCTQSPALDNFVDSISGTWQLVSFLVLVLVGGMITGRLIPLVRNIEKATLRRFDPLVVENMEITPNNAVSYFVRGKARYGRRRFAEAILDYDQALKLEPSLREAELYRSLAHTALERTAQRVAEDPVPYDVDIGCDELSDASLEECPWCELQHERTLDDRCPACKRPI